MNTDQTQQHMGSRRPPGARVILTGVAMALAFTLLAPAVAFAQSTVRLTEAEGTGTRRMDVALGKSFIVELPRDAKEVFVANPGVANAVVRGTRKVFVIASGVGQTSLFFMDAAGAQIGAIDINVQRDTSPIKAAIESALPGAQIEVRQLNEGLMLTGTVASAEEAAQAATIASKFMGGKMEMIADSITIRGRDQVMLKVTVAEVQRQVLKQLGVDLTASTSFLKLISDNPLPLNSQALTTGSISFGNHATMTAFERTGVLRTLAEPTLTAISGETAKFLAGGEIPVVQGSTLDTTTGKYIQSYVYKPIGVSLNFTPVVMNEGRISLHVSTEVTDIDYQNNLSVSGGSIPAFKVRRAETTVELPSGGTLGMAGMIQESMRQVANGTPGLMNLPILGTLFRSRDYQRNETELMILVTPYLAKSIDRKDVALPTDGFTDATDPSAWLLGRVNRIYGVKGAPRAPALSGHYGFIID
jgi:pilus assembly protein CpaC